MPDTGRGLPCRPTPSPARPGWWRTIWGISSEAVSSAMLSYRARPSLRLRREPKPCHCPTVGIPTRPLQTLDFALNVLTSSSASCHQDAYRYRSDAHGGRLPNSKGRAFGCDEYKCATCQAAHQTNLTAGTPLVRLYTAGTPLVARNTAHGPACTVRAHSSHIPHPKAPALIPPTVAHKFQAFLPT